MANTYTPKLNLAKPAHGDVDWHIPVNGNWDKIDTELDKALKISGTTIDADKDWNGKNITNLGGIGIPTRHAGVGSGFVDVPGSVLRKTISFTKVIEVGGDWVHLLTFSVPNDYANDIDSNCRILLSRTTTYYVSQNITVEAYVGDKLIGTGFGAYNSGTITINTTGGFRAGDTISLRGKCHTGSPHYPGTHTVSNCRIQSARHTSIPLVARYVEKTW